MSLVRKDGGGGTTATSSRSYDAFHRLQTVTETAARGETRTTTYAHDAAGGLTNVTVSAGGLQQST